MSGILPRIAVDVEKQPNYTADILSYASLILTASRLFHGEEWLQYGRKFCKKATVLLSYHSSNIDNSLQTMRFSSAHLKQHYKLCLTLTRTPLSHPLPISLYPHLSVI